MGWLPRVVLSVALLAAAGCAVAPPPKFVHFEPGTSRARNDDDIVQVGMAVSTLEGEPRLKAAVIGYASSEGTEAENKKLSFVRAEHIRDMMVHNGITAGRLTIAARGSANPAGPNDTEEGRAKNRRVELFFYDPSRGELQAQYGVAIEIQAR
jgi:outer membrane protein OmpA-like peptidoglycan-associated protein